MIKIINGLFLVAMMWLFTACPGNTYKSDLQQVQENNMNFPDLKKKYYDGISFKLSRLFNKSYATEYTLQDNSDVYEVYDMNVVFSIEKFSSYDAELIAFSFDDKIDLLDAVHDNYLIKRVESLDVAEHSIKKSLPETVKYPGVYQIIHGSTSYYDDQSTYMMATLEINDNYYVVHLIGKKDNMGYLYDDFKDILNSLN